jgi:surface polysaccharide O-acyltransferase-like enzyme
MGLPLLSNRKNRVNLETRNVGDKVAENAADLPLQPGTGTIEAQAQTTLKQAPKTVLNQIRGRPVYVDLIRTVAMMCVLLVHTAGRWIITPQGLQQLSASGFVTWAIVDIYQSIAVLGVPLFIMLTGALLLQPNKTETLSEFFKKRWARIGLPAMFWGTAYFVWDFLVMNIPFGAATIVQGILNGPYTQFWFIYVLIGLYLVTPILRVIIAHAEPNLIKYFILLWLIGVAVLPLFTLITSFALADTVFTLTGYSGYMVLGAYLSTIKLRRKPLVAVSAVGVALTAVCTFVLASTVGGEEMYFFQQYFSPTVVVSSAALFLLLLTIQPPSQTQLVKPSVTQKIIKAISINTLGIYLVHVMINESIQNGYLGITLNRDILNPIIEVPVLAIIVMFTSLAIIVALKKIPYLNKVVA